MARDPFQKPAKVNEIDPKKIGLIILGVAVVAALPAYFIVQSACNPKKNSYEIRPVEQIEYRMS